MTILAGRYELEERVAVGGMGEVWRARDSTLGRTVAVKTLKTELVQDPTFLTRFRNEARHTAGLSHPGLANVFDYGEQDGTPYLVMEFVEGEPLSTLLAREQRLPPDRTLDYVGQAALALNAAHDAGVIHRDVKPANLIVRSDGVVKVTDFGVARAADVTGVTQTGLVVGTAAYLSPEQASGRPVTPASDIYALGLVAYECLAGHRAFEGDSAVAVATAQVNQQPPPLPKDVPPLVSSFVLRALEKDPQRRQPDAGDFGRTALALTTALRAGTEPPPVTAAAPPAATKQLTVVDDDAQRRRTRNVFIGVGAAVVALGFLLLRACDPTSTTPHRAAHASSPTSTPSPLVTVRAADYLHEPVATARAALTSAGLVVRVTPAPTALPAGTVIAVAPTGALPPSSTVTLTVATPPPPPPARGGGKGKHEHGGHGDH